MKFLSQVGAPLVKVSPEVWVRRIVIFKQITPTPVVIRDISLKRGLNIIWAAEPEDGIGGDVAGHSAGKTTLCRLLRYVLGESTYSNKANMAAIKKTFPASYIAAELYVTGQLYAVLRPLGENRNSYILKDGTVEEVIAEKGEVAHQESYPQKLGLGGLVENFASTSIVRTNQPIDWQHVLAWCARDQEARFQNIYEWRSPRSESQSPAFRFPKSDPLFVMRVALGLFVDRELRFEETLAKSQQKLAAKEAALENARREPEYWRDHEDLVLREQLRAVLPQDANEISKAALKTEDMFPDLHRFSAKAAYELGEKAGKAEARQSEIEKLVGPLRVELAGLDRELAAHRALLQVGEKAGEQLAIAETHAQQSETQLENALNSLCGFGQVLISECKHVQDHRARLAPPLKGALVSDSEREARDAERANVENAIAFLERRIESKREKISLLESEQALLRAAIETHKRGIEGVRTALASLVLWTARAEDPAKFAKLKALSDEIDSMRTNIADKQVALNKLLAEHDATRDLLCRIFSTSVKRVLPSSAYDGAVRFEERELNFQITKRGTLTGEAMETLAVLLGDLSCLIFNSVSAESRLPGIMIHDSPREADLGERLYHSFIRFAAELDREFSEQGGCPFQYVLTTTTPPPAAIADSDSVRLRLDASKEEGLLLKQDVSQAVSVSLI